jgi:hypothetical protein
MNERKILWVQFASAAMNAWAGEGASFYAAEADKMMALMDERFPEAPATETTYQGKPLSSFTMDEIHTAEREAMTNGLVLASGRF